MEFKELQFSGHWHLKVRFFVTAQKFKSVLEGKVGPEMLVKEDLPQKRESWNNWHQTMMAGKCLWG